MSINHHIGIFFAVELIEKEDTLIDAEELEEYLPPGSGFEVKVVESQDRYFLYHRDYRKVFTQYDDPEIIDFEEFKESLDLSYATYLRFVDILKEHNFSIAPIKWYVISDYY